MEPEKVVRKFQFGTLEEVINELKQGFEFDLNSEESRNRLIKWLEDLKALKRYLCDVEFAYGNLRGSSNTFR